MEEIDPHLPIDKIAAYVVSNNNDAGHVFKCGSKVTSMKRLPTIQFVGPKQHDLTGRKCGRFTVIGCSLIKPGIKGQNKRTRWVVRCSCGRYQILSSKAVKKNSDQSMCVECARFKHKIIL